MYQYCAMALKKIMNAGESNREQDFKELGFKILFLNLKT